MPEYLLAFDADCGPCRRFRNAVGFLDTFGRLDFMSLERAEDSGLLDAIPFAKRHSSFHLVSPDGTALSGANALPKLISLLPSGTLLSRLLREAPGGLKTAAFVYSVASRLHNTGTCQYRPGEGHNRVHRTEILPHAFGVLR